MHTVLLVVNNKPARKTLRRVLSSGGYTVTESEFRSGSGRLDHERIPDVAVLDATCGPELVGKAGAQFPEVPVVCWMPWRDARLAVQLMTAGAAECVEAQAGAAEILEAVGHAGRRYPARDTGESFRAAGCPRALRRFLLYVGIVSAVLVGRDFLPAAASATVRLPFPLAGAVYGDVEHVWIADWYGGSIHRYACTRDTFRRECSYPYAAGAPVAITGDGESLWTIGNDLQLRRHSRDNPAVVLETHRLPLDDPSALAVRGREVWILDAHRRRLYFFRLGETLVLAGTAACPVAAPVGFSRAGNGFWLADGTTGTAYRYEKAPGAVRLRSSFSLPRHGRLAGACVSSGRIYAVYRGNPGRLFSRGITVPGEPDGGNDEP